ncbi:MAG: hypothetical protein PHU81_00075 [Acidobacteriota bacterium]|nr:hypothetical protein [Acidobacteriota bacterium]
MSRIKSFLVAFFILFLAFPLISFSETFKRSIDNKIEINPDGTALITRVENVPSPDLARVYSMHYKDMVKDKKLFNSFVSEIAKEYYFLYGTSPQFTFREMEVKEDGKSFTSTIRMKAAGLIKKENGNLTFSRKRIVDEKGQISEKVFLKYFENELDSKYFESAFLGSEKNSLATERSTEVVLPEGSKLQDIKPVFDKSPNDAWSVDFGGGSTYKAYLKKSEKGFLLDETIMTKGIPPKKFLDEKMNDQVFEELRNYTAFDVFFENEKIAQAKEELSRPVPHPVKDDFSGNWSYSVSSGERLTHDFVYQTLTITPGVTLTLTFSASLLWEHEWVKISWCNWKYRLKKFETTLSLVPSISPFVNAHCGASVQKNWSTTLFERGKTVTFWVSAVPVVLYLNAKLDAEADAKVSGDIDFNLSATFALNTSLTVKYQNGWSKTTSFSPSCSGVNFTADAKVEANAEGRLPFTLAAYVYNIAGPFVKLTPWLGGEVYASVGSSNQVGYAVKGGLKAEGGVQMAGWLKDLCDSIPSVSYTFFNWTNTLKQGTYTF